MQGVPGVKVNILGGHSVGDSKQKIIYVQYPIPNALRDRELVHCRIVE
jgi:hypothetical protein